MPIPERLLKGGDHPYQIGHLLEGTPIDSTLRNQGGHYGNRYV